MLTLLHIENIAVVERADLEPGLGFNVLTGETGAGKSIIIDAISAILGDRMSRDLIRSGEKTAFVSAVFSDLSQRSLQWLQDNAYSTEEDGTLLISRQLFGDGKNVCKLNGRPISVSQLKQLGALLINIHGQHDNQGLLDEASHLDYLDRYAEHADLLRHYQSSYLTLQRITQEIERLSLDESAKARRIDALRYQIDEIESAALLPGEEEELSARREILRNSERLTEAVEQSFVALFGDDESAGAASLFDLAASNLERASLLDPKLHTMKSALDELRYGIEDLVEEIRDLREEYQYSPEEMETIESRLDLLHRLQKKYGRTVHEILQNLETYRRELDEIVFAEEAIEKLKGQLDQTRTEALRIGHMLRAGRETAAAELAARIRSELEQLDMRNARFETEVTPLNGLGPNGLDSVRFLLSANAGEEPRPLSRIASGGELSRIMLAMKNVLAEGDDVHTLIFDEVDTGISGRAAQKVGEKLLQVSFHKQILSVTHLAQIAAMADHHYLIEKKEHEGRTYTLVERLDHPEQVREVARIISGSSIPDAALATAEEMILSAAQRRKELTTHDAI